MDPSLITRIVWLDDAVVDFGRPSHSVEPETVAEALDRAEELGLPMQAGSPLEDLTVAELLMLVNTPDES